MTSKERIDNEYASLSDKIHFDENSIDRKDIDDIVSNVARMAALSRSAVAVYDSTRLEHIYESPAHKDRFRGEDGTYSEIIIHPEDYVAVIKNAISAMKFVFKNNSNAINIKLIRTYRAFVFGKYRNITEEFIPLKTDAKGNIWLLLSITNVSVEQTPPVNVRSTIIDNASGDVFSLSDEMYASESILSARETEILKLVAQGKLSKEIADILQISVATVNTHRQNILQHLNADNSMEAVSHAHSLGLI